MVDGVNGLIGQHALLPVVVESRQNLGFAPTPNLKLVVTAALAKMSCLKVVSLLSAEMKAIKRTPSGLHGQAGLIVLQLVLEDTRPVHGAAEDALAPFILETVQASRDQFK